MSYIGIGVEYAMHCLLWVAQPLDEPPSSRELAELQGCPAPFLKKIFSKLEKAGIVVALDGIRGGYRLARPPAKISLLDVVEAVEGKKPIFDCQQIRTRCIVFNGKPPDWATEGVCGVHAAMCRAEEALRHELSKTTLATLARQVRSKVPATYTGEVRNWLSVQAISRTQKSH